MKRLLLVFVFAFALLGLLATPAFAFYASQEKTAYITSFVPYDENGVRVADWISWNGGNDVAYHVGPIPHGWNVVVTREWFDARLGATLIPAEYFNTMAISGTSDGSPCFSFAITKAACGLRYWSPAYKLDPAGDPQLWARDWWVPLGKLPPGDYSGWVTQFAPHAFPTWMDQYAETAEYLPLLHPIWLQPVDWNWTQDISFTMN
jgi:hypothetical protein